MYKRQVYAYAVYNIMNFKFTSTRVQIQENTVNDEEPETKDGVVWEKENSPIKPQRPKRRKRKTTYEVSY